MREERHLHFTLHTNDGLRLHAREWLPSGEPRAVLCLVHGHGEHSGRYEHVARFLNHAGCGLLAMDLRGHGRSAGQRGHVGSYDLLLADIAVLLDEAARRHPDLPRFLYGHSMGGNLVLNCALRRGDVLSGIIASAPMLRTAFDPPAWKDLLGRLMIRLWPAMPLRSGLETEALSRDPEVVHAYREDPLVHDRVTPRFLEVLEAGRWTLQRAADLSLPLLLMHGDADRITSAQASVQFAARAGCGCTLQIWPGLYHEIHNEPEKGQVLSRVTEWLERVMVAPPTTPVF